MATVQRTPAHAADGYMQHLAPAMSCRSSARMVPVR